MQKDFKILDFIGHQGDVQFYAIDAIPTDAKKIAKQFVAASEKSGHVHALNGNYDMYELEDGFLLDVKETSIFNHTSKSLLNAETWDKATALPEEDHGVSVIEKGKYFVGIQQRFDPIEAARKNVKD
jgi:hypothetical protein